MKLNFRKFPSILLISLLFIFVSSCGDENSPTGTGCGGCGVEPLNPKFELQNAQDISANEFLNMLPTSRSQDFHLGHVVATKTIINGLVIEFEDENGQPVKIGPCNVDTRENDILHSIDSTYLYEVNNSKSTFSGPASCSKLVSNDNEKILYAGLKSNIETITRSLAQQLLDQSQVQYIKKGTYNGRLTILVSALVRDTESGQMIPTIFAMDPSLSTAINPIYIGTRANGMSLEITKQLVGLVDPSDIDISDLDIVYETEDGGAETSGSALNNRLKINNSLKAPSIRKMTKSLNNIFTLEDTLGFDMTDTSRIGVDEFLNLATRAPSRNVALGTNVRELSKLKGIYLDFEDLRIGPCTINSGAQQVLHSKDSDYLYQYQNATSTGSGAEGCELLSGEEEYVLGRLLENLRTPNKEEMRTLLNQIQDLTLVKGLYEGETHLLVAGKSADPESGDLVDIRMAFNPSETWAVNPIYLEVESQGTTYEVIRKVLGKVDPSTIDISELPVEYEDGFFLLDSIRQANFRIPAI